LIGGVFLPENAVAGFQSSGLCAGHFLNNQVLALSRTRTASPSLGWTSTTNQTSTDWAANNVGTVDLEDDLGPVRKTRPVSRTGNRVVWCAEMLR
jgi:hypothetical protein